MQLHKTDLARAALADTKSGALSLHQRRILILTDGKRSINDLMAMLGSDILGEVDALMRAGFLSASEASGVRPQLAAGLGQLLRGAATKVRNATTPEPSSAPREAVAPIAAAPSPAPASPVLTPAPAPAAITARRSLAASKMYVMDLLQMQRDLRIAECRTEIQCAQDEASTVVALLDGVRQLIPLVSTGMATRIVARLDDILPEPFLPALRALESEITGKPVLAITNIATNAA